VGSEEPRKGLTMLLRALHYLPNSKQYQLEIVGLKELRHPHNKKLAEDLAINFHGAVYDRKNVYKIISLCDILVMPSFAEKQGKVQLEAMAVGTVPICSDSGGTYCTIKNLHNGILVGEGNYREIASSISRLYNEPDLYSEMQKNGLDYTKNIESVDVFSNIAKLAKLHFSD
jgi:glycosyltransferase involved in cell wall biosynthesis